VLHPTREQPAAVVRDAVDDRARREVEALGSAVGQDEREVAAVVLDPTWRERVDDGRERVEIEARIVGEVVVEPGRVPRGGGRDAVSLQNGRRPRRRRGGSASSAG
jgi:hypothetical protein